MTALSYLKCAIIAIGLLFAGNANAITYTLTGTIDGGTIAGTLDGVNGNNLEVDGFLFTGFSLDVTDAIGFQENRLLLTLDPFGNDFTAVYTIFQQLYPGQPLLQIGPSFGSGTYTETPLPAAFLLFVSGLSFLGLLGRRKRSNA